jgi:AcrR family transcriptional regulator
VPRVSADVRREQFIAAAINVIAEHGVDGATTRRIADAAGAPLASLHYCFRSKEELLWAIWELEAQEIWSTPSVRAHDGTTGLAAVAAGQLETGIRWWMEHESRAITNIELGIWARRQNRELGARAYDIYLEASYRYLRRHLGPNDDPALVEPLARLISAAVDGLLLQWFTFQDRDVILRDVAVWSESIAALVDARSASAAHSR